MKHTPTIRHEQLNPGPEVKYVPLENATPLKCQRIIVNAYKPVDGVEGGKALANMLHTWFGLEGSSLPILPNNSLTASLFTECILLHVYVAHLWYRMCYIPRVKSSLNIFPNCVLVYIVYIYITVNSMICL